MFDDDLVWAAITHGEKTSVLFYPPFVFSSTQIFGAMRATAQAHRVNVIDGTCNEKRGNRGFNDRRSI